MAGNDKEFLIRVRADIQQALTDLKKLPPEVRATGGKETLATHSTKAGPHFRGRPLAELFANR